MTSQRRVAKLEASLPVQAALRLWLDEAQGFGSLAAYAAWLVDQPLTAAPFVRVPEAAEAAAHRAMGGQPRDAVRDAMTKAIEDAVFRVLLVLELNRAGEATLHVASLRDLALAHERRAIEAATTPRGAGRTTRQRA